MILSTFSYGDKCAADPLNGKSEGWPVPTAEAMIYLAEKGVKCAGIDAQVGRCYQQSDSNTLGRAKQRNKLCRVFNESRRPTA